MVTGIRYPNHLRGGEFFHFHFVNHKRVWEKILPSAMRIKQPRSQGSLLPALRGYVNGRKSEANTIDLNRQE